MPVKLQAQVQRDQAEARIEIIPLIDIMFFLLASFMLVSLSMVNLKSVSVNLPAAVTGSAQSSHDLVDISIDKAGTPYLDKKPIGDNALIAALAGYQRANPAVRIIISADSATHHGDVIHVLDLARLAGIQRVAFETRESRP
jgi:biopolymer transport protein ExbD